MTETLNQLEFPLDRKCPYEPPAEYGQLREEAPISRVNLPDGRWAWAITRHEDVRAVLNDRRFSSNRYNPNFPILVTGGTQIRGPESDKALISMDAPEHSAARRAVVGEFTVKRMQALQPRIQEIVDQQIDAILAGEKPADLVELLSLPVPSLVICEMLGVPYADHDLFQRNTAVMINRLTPPEERRAAVMRVREYIDGLITEKEKAPGDDLLGRQIVKLREEGTYHHGKLVSLGFLLLLAGHETTANMISLGTFTFLQHPEQLAAVRDDPGKTLDAVEELLRYYTIVDVATARVCVEDAEIGGVTIKAGDGVLALGFSANRDPEVFEDADAFDLDRGARHHVAFGFGPHQCLGQNLARMELQIVFDTLFRRIPTLKLAASVEELPFKDDAAIYGLYRLPVTW